jgi:hypothetical protein
MSPLHRFLGCLFLRRHLHHMVRQEEQLQLIPSNDHTTVVFQAQGFAACKVSEDSPVV